MQHPDILNNFMEEVEAETPKGPPFWATKKQNYKFNETEMVTWQI